MQFPGRQRPDQAPLVCGIDTNRVLDDLMEAKLIRAVVVLGVPGVALVVFYLLLHQFGFTFSTIGPVASALLAALFLVLAGFVTIFALQGWRVQHEGPQLDDALGWYESLRVGMLSPIHNVEQIQRIANSTDPNRKRYLEEFGNSQHISFLELDATRDALSGLKNGATIEDLFQRVSKRERAKIEAMIPETSDPLFRPIMIVLKYWRYVNRHTHPAYADVSTLLANALARQGFSSDELALARRIVDEERQRIG